MVGSERILAQDRLSSSMSGSGRKGQTALAPKTGLHFREISADSWSIAIAQLFHALDHHEFAVVIAGNHTEKEIE